MAVSLSQSNPFIRKLSRFVPLTEDDCSQLHQVSTGHPRHYAPRTDIIREGETPQVMFLLMSGWAYRYKQLEDGRRQILAFFLPGDLCDLNNHILAKMDHSMGTITQATVVALTPETIATLMAGSPRIQQGLWWETLVNIAIQREWTVNLGQRSAFERVGHLLCELFLRLGAAGFAERDTCEMPLTQAELADATGLSAVHANRTLQELRSAGLIVLKDRTLTIPNLRRLQEVTLFNPNYLHLDNEGPQLDTHPA